MERIISQKQGTLIKKSEDIFEENIIKCSNGHTFYLLENDIILGKWCDKCVDELDIILQDLKLSFEKNKKINNFVYDYVLKNQRKFVIFKIKDNFEELVSNAKEENFNIIAIKDIKEKNLNQKIWESIKNNIEITYIGLKNEISKEHKCDIVENLGNEKGDEGSLVKSMIPPFPFNRKRMKGYIRVSTVMQVQDGFSLEAQESKINKETEKWNGYLHSIYIDRGISGGSMSKRLALDRMLKSLESEDWIIVNSVSRLARNTKDLLSIVEMIEEKNCHLLILDLNLDITSPSGKLILTLIGSQAQFEREITSERVKGVMQHLKNTGNLRTKPPFGWKMNPDYSTGSSVHIRDEEEQIIIGKIRILRSKYQDISITQFSEKLNQEKLEPPRKSKKWYHRTVKDIMTREGIK